MYGGHPRAIDKQVYNTNGPNLMGRKPSAEDSASGLGIWAFGPSPKNNSRGRWGCIDTYVCMMCLLGNWTKNVEQWDKG
jgi:hypothetical protein